MNHIEYVILGGGVAGLCAAKRLLELGICPTVIEAGGYPSHKICGEFISPSSLPILEKWKIFPVPVHQMQLYTASENLHLLFPQSAGSLSHLTFDFELANQISNQGASLLTHTKVEDFSPAIREGDDHCLTLSSGERIKAKHLFIATGRLPGSFSQPLQPLYIGLKAHFSGLELNSTLHLFSFKGAYLGVTPVENGSANLACLATIEQFKQFSSSEQFMQNLITSHPVLRNLLASGSNLFDGWMEAFVPEFGLRTTSHWPRTYWIGDAAGTIPPASGNGLSLAIASGYLAAEFALKDEAQLFKKEWKKKCYFQIKLAKGLHRLFLNPFWGSKGMLLNKFFPCIGQKAFTFTRIRGCVITS